MPVRGITRTRAGRAIVVVLVGVLFAAVACAEDDSGSDTTTTAASDTTSEDSAAATQWGLKFTGGTAGAASGEPYRIGFAHSSDFFPEGDTGAQAAVDWINAELGGVGGRPLELVSCNIGTPEDASACGAQLANDDSIDLVVSGLVLYGSADLYAALAGKAATIMGAPLDASDYLTENAVAYNTGALGAGIGGAEYVNSALEPKTSALIATDDVAGRGGAAALAPINEQYGVDVQTVFVSPTATAPEIASALQAAGAADTDVISIGLFEQGCIAAYDALQSLGLGDRPIVTTTVCSGNAMQTHLEDVGAEYQFPDGWTFVGGSVYDPDPSEDLSAYLTKFAEYGDESVVASTAAPLTFAAMMNAAKILNQVGVDGASYDTLDAAVRGFQGPAWLQTGPIECGVAPYVSICASQVPVLKFEGGEWKQVEAAVDISKYTHPGG